MHQVEQLAAEASLKERDAREWVSRLGFAFAIDRSNAPEVIDVILACERILNGRPLQQVTRGNFVVCRIRCAMVVTRFSKRMHVDRCRDHHSLIFCEIDRAHADLTKMAYLSPKEGIRIGRELVTLAGFIVKSDEVFEVRHGIGRSLDRHTFFFGTTD